MNYADKRLASTVHQCKKLLEKGHSAEEVIQAVWNSSDYKREMPCQTCSYCVEYYCKARAGNGDILEYCRSGVKERIENLGNGYVNKYDTSERRKHNKESNRNSVS